MPKKSKYTASEKKAYYSGMGYRAGEKGKRIPYKSKRNYNSFVAGYRAARATVDKYPKK